MIILQRQGAYALTETFHQIKVLRLDMTAYAWLAIADIGEILVTTRTARDSDYTLSLGSYRLYAVKDEPGLSGHQHLELEVGNRTWQGYLLLTGLPDAHSFRSRIIPTNEIISGTRRAGRENGLAPAGQPAPAAPPTTLPF